MSWPDQLPGAGVEVDRPWAVVSCSSLNSKSAAKYVAGELLAPQ